MSNFAGCSRWRQLQHGARRGRQLCCRGLRWQVFCPLLVMLMSFAILPPACEPCCHSTATEASAYGHRRRGRRLPGWLMQRLHASPRWRS